MLIIEFNGGFGNQMFEYAFYKKQEYLKKDVRVCLSKYEAEWSVPFCLTAAFPAVRLNCDGAKEEYERIIGKLKNPNIASKLIYKLNPSAKKYYGEKSAFEYDINNLSINDGIQYGFWQSEKYWKEIKDSLIEDFTFARIENEKANELLNICKKDNTVSVHIRRGDYLNPEIVKTFGNICTDEYYEKAMNYFTGNYDNITFIFFSNDTEWIKEKYSDRNDIIFAADYLDESIPDWYEMFLMSQCSHNIIANSSFSWWGAYLNKNPKKKVAAPPFWANNCKTDDVYPEVMFTPKTG